MLDNTRSCSCLRYSCPIDRISSILQTKFRRIESLAQCHRARSDKTGKRSESCLKATWDHRSPWVKKTRKNKAYFKWLNQPKVDLQSTVSSTMSITSSDKSAPRELPCPPAAPLLHPLSRVLRVVTASWPRSHWGVLGMGMTTFRGQRQPWERERTHSPPLQGARSGGCGTLTTALDCGSREPKVGRAVQVTRGGWEC